VSVGKQKSGQRRCPLCAEVIKTDATRCRFCGSTLAGVQGLEWSSDDAKGGDAAADWSAPAKGDVGLSGIGAVVGALVAFAIGAWFDAPGVPPAMALAGAGVGWFMARTFIDRPAA
jgi:hypothetical protein